MLKKTKKTRFNKKRVDTKTILLGASILSMIVLMVYWFQFHNNNSTIEITDSSSQNEIEVENGDRSENSGVVDESKSYNTPVKQFEDGGQNTDNTNNIGVKITVSEYSKDQSKVVVRAIVDGVQSGACIATFSKSGQKSFTATSSISAVTAYYSCGKLDVSRSRFSTAGNWKVIVTAKSGDESATSSAKIFAIE